MPVFKRLQWATLKAMCDSLQLQSLSGVNGICKLTHCLCGRIPTSTTYGQGNRDFVECLIERWSAGASCEKP